jgi:dipeptidase
MLIIEGPKEKNMMRRFLFSMTVVLVLILGTAVPAVADDEKPEECTVLIAGKNTTADGSILFAKTEDDGPRDIDYFWYIPRKKFKPGSVIKLQGGGTLPQVEETYAYFWDECPGSSFSNGIINEWGVAFGSNGCVSKEDPVEKVEARGDLLNGGLGFELRMILAERSKTAREAVRLAAELLDKYGYNASGRNLNIVGPDEAWQLQMVRGKNYAARKVQDDEVAIIANTFSIRDVDMNDRENFICSPGLIDYAIKRGWYDSSSGEKFDFAKAYAPRQSHCNPANTHRQWYMAHRLNENFPITWQEAQTGIMPVSVKPDRKLTLEDVMGIFRSHYEGTDLDQSNHYEKSPHKSPFFTICNYGSHRTTIVQQRNWLPVDIGTVTWRALERPCSNVFVPWYLGITEIPGAFHKAPESLYTTQKELLDYHFHMPDEAWNLDLESSAAVFKLLAKLVDVNYKKTIGMVQNTWKEFEEREFAMQPVIEESALKLYEKDKSLAEEFLTFYSNAQALKSLEVANNLINRLKTYPQTPEACTEMGLFYFEYGNSELALEQLEKALEMDPENANGKRCLKWVRDMSRAENDPMALPVNTLKRFVGDYGPRHITIRDNILYYHREGGSEFRLIPISDDTFALKGINYFQLHFASNENGEIVKIIGLYLDGRKDESLKNK